MKKLGQTVMGSFALSAALLLTGGSNVLSASPAVPGQGADSTIVICYQTTLECAVNCAGVCGSGMSSQCFAGSSECGGGYPVGCDCTPIGGK